MTQALSSSPQRPIPCSSAAASSGQAP
uniref:Uncharacterized protein n=1 Tax=Arundo donax TaxID=35708 RepID=A0A0A9BEK1_ARUDO